MRHYVALANALLLLVTAWIVPTTTAFVAPFPATTITTKQIHVQTSLYEASSSDATTNSDEKTQLVFPLETNGELRTTKPKENLIQSLLLKNTTTARIAHHVVQSVQCAKFGVTYTVRNIFSTWLLRCMIPTTIVTNLLGNFLTMANSDALNMAYCRTLKGIAVLCETYFNALYVDIFRQPRIMLRRFLPQKKWVSLIMSSYMEEAIYRVIPFALLMLFCTKVLGKKEPGKVLERRWDTIFTFLFGFVHLTNHFSLTDDVETLLPTSYRAVYQSLSAFLVGRSLFLPLFKSHGFAAAAASHAILNMGLHLTPNWAIHFVKLVTMQLIVLELLWKPARMTFQGGKSVFVADLASSLWRACWSRCVNAAVETAAAKAGGETAEEDNTEKEVPKE